MRAAWAIACKEFRGAFASPVAYAYLGYAGREALGGGGDLIQNALIAIGLLAAVSLLPSLIKRLRAGSGLGPGGSGRAPGPSGSRPPPARASRPG